MNEFWFYAMWVVCVYALGSVSIGDLVTRACGVDIRKLGTGNPGTANIFREMGPKYAVITFVGDVLKGAASTVPVLVLGLPAWLGLVSSCSLLCGHFFPVPWRFVGGTGLATGMGIAIGLLPLGVTGAMLPAVITMAITRNAAITGTVFFVLAAGVGWILHENWVAVCGVTLVGVAIFFKARIQYRT